MDMMESNETVEAVDGMDRYGHGHDGGCRKPFARPQALPTPRLVSINIHKDTNRNEAKVTHMLTQFGQFLDHDLSLTPEHEEDECCESSPPADCFPIKVPFNDPFYSR